MAVNTIIDNAVIDFTQITSILETLNTHENLFQSLIKGNMASISAINSNSTSTPPSPQFISAGNLSFVGIRYMTQLSNGNATGTVQFGRSFDGIPIVTATAKLVGTTTTVYPAVFIKNIQLSSCDIAIHDTSGSKTNVTIEVQILAMGAATQTIA